MKVNANLKTKKNDSLISSHEIKEHAKILKKIPGVTTVKHNYSVESSSTLNWGVDYDANFISRECYQNMRDGCVSQNFPISDVKTSFKSGLTIVEGPSEFNLKLLFYIGGTKATDDTQLGTFGEGAVISAISLIKLGVDCPIFTSGEEAIVISASEDDNELGLRPLIYSFYKIKYKNKESKKGSKIVISSFKESIREAFKSGLEDHFYWPENPNLGEFLYSYNSISFYKSKKENGQIFYNGLSRGEVDFPLIINIEKKYAKIEKKISKDRDRNTFNQDLRSQFFNIAAASGFHHSEDAQNPAIQYILEQTQHIWKKNGGGHPLLSAVCNHVWNLRSEDSSDYLDELFKPSGKTRGYFSESTPRYAPYGYGGRYWEKEPEIFRMDRAFENKGYQKLPGYFTRLGIKSSIQILEEKKEKAEEKAKRDSIRELNKKETSAINFLLKSLKTVAPGFSGVFYAFEDTENIQIENNYGSLYSISFKILKSDKILGELKDSASQFDEKTVYLNGKLFSQSFGSIMSTLLHELQHTFGHMDGSRIFGDQLTILLKIMIDHPDELAKCKKQWEEYRIV